MLGLGAGAVYAALALGLVLTYRASGVVNVAHGAMAMYATYVYVELRSAGDLVLPLAGLPARIHVTDRPPVALALALAVAVAAGLGLVVYGVVFRPLRAAPPLARIVAAVGLLVTLQAAVTLQFGPSNRPVPAILPSRPLSLFGLVVPSDRLFLAALVVAAATGLWAAYRFTRFGLATRAAAENETGAALLGYSPEALAAGNWVIASVLGALGGILVGPITALNPVTYTLLVVPALAAALVGRLSSFGVTVVAALALGVAQSTVVRLDAGVRAVPALGLRDALPFVVIVAVVVLRGRLVPDRLAAVAARLPAAGRPRRPLTTTTVAVLGGGAALLTLGSTYRLALITSMLGAIVCLSLVLLTGYVGQLSLAQLAFAGIAGFSLSRLSAGLGVPFPLAPVLAAAAAALAGLLVGLAARRVRGVDLAVVTLAAAVAIEELAFGSPLLTGGLAGSPVPAPSLLGVDLGIGGRRAAVYPRPVFGFLVLGVLAATALAVAAVRRGRTGRRLLAVRANERAAEAAGVDTAATKLLAFTVSALVAGLAGALVGYARGQLSVDSFGVFLSLSFLAVAYLGGITRIAGALVGGALVPGGIVFTVLDAVAGLGKYQLLVTGLGLVAATILAPEGLAGAAAGLVGRVRRRGRLPAGASAAA